MRNKLALDLACSSDIRVCTPDLILHLGHGEDQGRSVEEVLKDMPPALRLLDSVSLVCELLMAGAAITAEDAKQLGFVSKVLESQHQAINEAQKLAGGITLRERRTARTGLYRDFIVNGVIEDVSRL